MLHPAYVKIGIGEGFYHWRAGIKRATPLFAGGCFPQELILIKC